MIAARHDPGRRRQQRRGRIKEIGLPGGQGVARRAALAGVHPVGAGAFAIKIIADMHHQIGLPTGRRRRNAGKGIGVWVVAGLPGAALLGRLQAASRIPNHHDLAHQGRRKGQGVSFQRGVADRGGQADFADGEGKVGGRGAGA